MVWTEELNPSSQNHGNMVWTEELKRDLLECYNTAVVMAAASIAIRKKPENISEQQKVNNRIKKLNTKITSIRKEASKVDAVLEYQRNNKTLSQQVREFWKNIYETIDTIDLSSRILCGFKKHHYGGGTNVNVHSKDIELLRSRPGRDPEHMVETANSDARSSCENLQ
ncbi:hypothetical protein QE152_g32327 [Popillia japonica]|uniref:Uncharacterized protein n=1 Tax=Popillia japonica TaxID=7064 RepID=A0AAW1IZ34_POPJA